MITRAQAEALLTLAESLEGCEQQGLLAFPYSPVEFRSGIYSFVVRDGSNGELTGMSVRLAVGKLISKQET